jgi:NADH:ubiquinone oxidoreductase subunit 2 (subunit N)
MYLYLVLNFIYLLITTLEISAWHFRKKNGEFYSSVMTFYKKLEQRVQFMSIFIVLELIYLKIFNIDHTFYFSNKVLAINITSLSFQLLLIFLSFLTLKQSKGQFFRAKEQFLLFPIFFLSNLFFLSLLLVANHLMVVLIAIMGINLGLYVLLFVDTQKNRLESGLKYFFLSIFVIILLYISILLIYLLTYNLDIISISYTLINSTIFDQRVLGFIYLLLVFVFFFKSGIFPSNFFLPEIYKGLSPVLFLYLTLPMKATFFAFIIKLFEILINNNSYN